MSEITALMLALAFSTLAVPALAGASGQAGHDSVLLGMHFVQGRTNPNVPRDQVGTIYPTFWDCLQHIPEDIEHVSYADFWWAWSSFERYKGDEAGLAELDEIVDESLRRGIKVKIDLIHSTWYTNDRDWPEDPSLAVGPVDVDDWVHLCDTLARHYRGRIALWHLQGEANDLKSYWRGAPIELVQEVYKEGYRAFKRVDPDVLISISGASPSASREDMDAWYRGNLSACKGLFDEVAINYFSDVLWADPYHGFRNWWAFLKDILNGIGEKDAEIGSGESSFQWAEDSYKVTARPPRWDPDYDTNTQPVLSEEGQAWRLNDTLGAFYSWGGTKWMFWPFEGSPGFGWPWRWGLRKYQDWWGVFPADKKVPGTNIVFGYDNPDGRKVDLRPGWTSSETDPYHPAWWVYRFWAQATPPGAEAVRLPVSPIPGPEGTSFILATYLRTQDRCVLLLQNNEEWKPEARVDLRKTGWPEGAALSVRVRSETIDYVMGARREVWTRDIEATVKGGALSLEVPECKGFVTAEIAPAQSEWKAQFVEQGTVTGLAGSPIDAVVVVRNTGREAWKKDEVRLAMYEGSESWKLPRDVKPGDAVSVSVRFPPAALAGRESHLVRMQRGSDCFGPSCWVTAIVQDTTAPRKLLAFRELGHIRLKWFAPASGEPEGGYELQRADGPGRPFAAIKTLVETHYIDEPTAKDKACYYRVVALGPGGKRSLPSNEDNAKALSKPRLYDAEIVSHSVPGRVRRGEPSDATVTIRNTGSKAWNVQDTQSFRLGLVATQQWGDRGGGIQLRMAIERETAIQPGEEVTLTFPYVAPAEGRFENHWVMHLEAPGKASAYFGTPLIVETEATP